MSIPAWLFIVGGLAELAGLFIVAMGFLELWRAFGGGQRFSAPLTDGLLRAGRRVRTALRLNRPRVVHASGSALLVGVTATARATVLPGPPPSITDDPEAFAAAIYQQVRDLYQRTQDAQHRAEDLAKRDRETHRSDVAALRGEISDVNTRVRDVAIGDIRLQVFGWVLVFVGFGMQAASQLLTLQY